MGSKRSFRTAREGELGLTRITNASGLDISALPNGCLFALEHEQDSRRTMLNQVFGSPLGSGIGRILLRIGGAAPRIVEAMGPSAKVAFGAHKDRFVWEGEEAGLSHRVTLWLHPSEPLWLWRVEIANKSAGEAPCDAIFVQDLGLGPRGLLLNNEAYASQYIDHTVPRHSAFGPVIMSRQNMAQDDRHPWAAHGCFEGAASFATDGVQLFGPAFRDADEVALEFGTNLPGVRLQHECACAILQSHPARLAPAETAAWTFFGLFAPDHAEPTSDADLARIDAASQAARAFTVADVAVETPMRSVLQDASPLVCLPLSDTAPRILEERGDSGELLSYFVEDGALNRHAVLREKDRLVKRRHGAILRSGGDLLPNDSLLSATCWMHGVFAAQLSIANSSFHKLFSVSRDAYNITRASGLRVLAQIGGAWRLLTVPSLFEMGLSECRWDYRHDGGTISVHVIAAGDEPALSITLTAKGEPCRFLVFGHLIMGEHDYAQTGRVEIDDAKKAIAFRPEPNWLWGERYPDAVYHLVTSTPGVIEAIGGDELLYGDGTARGLPYVAFRTRPASEVRFAIVGSMTDAAEAQRLADKYATGVTPPALRQTVDAFWSAVMGRALAGRKGTPAFNAAFPWLVHNALIHLSAPHGLEQYSGGAWGTRDVCQGPIELLLALGHHDAAKKVLLRVFARQRRADGDWPQWFFLEPYSFIQAADAHGDIIVWPLKAVCDYIEATGDSAFLNQRAPWGLGSGAEEAEETSIAGHIEALLQGVTSRFIAGTHLPRYGNGDWNDTLQPADLALRDWMVSSWTAALLFQQVARYADVLAQAGESAEGMRLSRLAEDIRHDFNRFLIRDGVVGGYALFHPQSGEPEILLHPGDRKTGIHFSLIAMTCAIAGGLFTPEQARDHLRLIGEHLSFPDGVRLMDGPLPYHGGVERMFRRAESSPFFGREVGLMYAQAHLRFCEALALLGEDDAMEAELRKVNPVEVVEAVPNAVLRQRNCYFTSSDAAFDDRYQASEEWDRVKAAAVPFEGGWRLYSGGPGLFVALLMRQDDRLQTVA